MSWKHTSALCLAAQHPYCRMLLVLVYSVLFTCEVLSCEGEARSTNGAAAEVTLQQISDSFEDFEKHLIAAARAKAEGFEEQGKQAYAFDLIGKYRLAKAAPVLLDQIEVRDVRPKSEEYPLASFPAAAALAEIGSPCLGSIFDRCRRPLTNRQADLVACVLTTIYGDHEIASVIVKKELARIRAIPPRKINVDIKPLVDSLERVLSYCRDKDFSNPHAWPK